MATNSSILAAFERMWHHIISKFSNYYTSEQVDNAIEDSKEIFWATYGETTWNEISDAVVAGRTVKTETPDGVLLELTVDAHLDRSYFVFGATYYGQIYVAMCATDNTWDFGSMSCVTETSGYLDSPLYTRETISLNYTPSNDNHAVNKLYVDNAIEELQTSLAGAATQNIWYGTCPTAANTTAKVVTTSSGDFSLTTGSIVYVLFTYNAYTGSTLNVDGTGAVTIKAYGTTNVTTYQWGANEVVGFVYDGTYFRMLNGMIATTTYYGMTKLSSSTSSSSTSTAATSSAVKAAYDLANGKASTDYVDSAIATAIGNAIGSSY